MPDFLEIEKVTSICHDKNRDPDGTLVMFSTFMFHPTCSLKNLKLTKMIHDGKLTISRDISAIIAVSSIVDAWQGPKKLLSLSFIIYHLMKIKKHRVSKSCHIKYHEIIIKLPYNVYHVVNKFA